MFFAGMLEQLQELINLLWKSSKQSGIEEQPLNLLLIHLIHTPLPIPLPPLSSPQTPCFVLMQILYFQYSLSLRFTYSLRENHSLLDYHTPVRLLSQSLFYP